ncbi:MAG: hypothetical protein QXL94_01585 [Candidatus Parvarchaeum sp.]
MNRSEIIDGLREKGYYADEVQGDYIYVTPRKEGHFISIDSDAIRFLEGNNYHLTRIMWGSPLGILSYAVFSGGEVNEKNR